ncbi:MAG: efflux RND transporter permease subunit, partial [Planctomycetaceae bacterium]
MKSLISRAVSNAPGMNTLMVAILIIGGISLFSMRREEFPEFELEMILVSVPYPGASPEEVEEGICLKIEEAVRGLDGIKKQTSIAAEGMGSLVLEIEADVPDVQRLLSEIRSEIDRIPSFPELAEDPDIKQVTMRRPAIRVAVIGPDSRDPDAEFKLREVTEQVRDGLLMLPNVTQAT